MVTQARATGKGREARGDSIHFGHSERIQNLTSSDRGLNILDQINVNVCVKLVVYDKIELRWRGHYMLSISNVSGADCYNVLSWLLFLQKLAKRLHISN